MTHSPQQARRAAVASFAGTALEWYDFFLFGAATALVFGPQFFPTSNPVVSQLASFGTFAVGFLTRPIGGMIAGHFGDRVGRKKVLVLSVLIMGSATVLIGVLPNYAQIGVAAPVLLVTLRLLQGLAVGAEWGGAALMAVEHAPSGRRTLFGSFTQSGVPAGAILSSVVMLVLVSLTGPAFTQWGWRIGFLLSIFLVVFGVVIRRRLAESPVFADTIQGRPPVRIPLVRVIREHPLGVLVAIFATAASPALGYIVAAYTLSYGTKVIGFKANEVLLAITIASVLQLFTMYLMAAAADRWGRLRMMIIGSAAQVGAALAMFPLINTGIWGLALLGCALVSCSNAAQYSALPAMMADLFPDNMRYTGLSLGYQFGGVVGGSFAPIIATGIFASTGSSLLIGVYMAGLTIISGLAILLAHSRSLIQNRADNKPVLAAAGNVS